MSEVNNGPSVSGIKSLTKCAWFSDRGNVKTKKSYEPIHLSCEKIEDKGNSNR